VWYPHDLVSEEERRGRKKGETRLYPPEGGGGKKEKIARLGAEREDRRRPRCLLTKLYKGKEGEEKELICTS